VGSVVCGRGGVTVRVESWQARPGMDASGPGLGLGTAGSIPNLKSSNLKARATAWMKGVSALSPPASARLPSAADSERGLEAGLKALDSARGL
jgi:hypothetical protein